ncbi:MAG: acyl-CoA dehydrogenase family protein [Gracilibacteraceae bacterium]|nr:acyl-CoA dehydrogenase family protein [Gracilibacteraceae bacterium]
MFYGFSEEDLLIRETAREYAQRELSQYANAQNYTPETARKVARELGELGLLGMHLPTEYGGSGATAVQLCAVIEEIATVADDFATMFAKSHMDGNALLKYGSKELQQKYLPRIISGEIFSANALTEAGIGSDASNIEMSAVLGKDGNWHLNGEKMFCTQINNHADIFLVAAQTDKELKQRGIACFIVERSFPGFAEAKAGEAVGESELLSITELIFNDLIVPPENIVGKVGEGFAAMGSALSLARVTMGANTVGICQQAINETIKYVKQRKQFGREIAQFQLVQGKLADMVTLTEAARSLTYATASLLDQDKCGHYESSVCKYFCSEIVQRVTNDAVQLFGGYGLCREYPVIRLWEVVRKFTIVDGTSDIQRLILGRELTGFNALKR